MTRLSGLEALLAIVAIASVFLAAGVLLGSWSHDIVIERDRARAALAQAREQLKLYTWATAQELHDLDHYGPGYGEECTCVTCFDSTCPCDCHQRGAT
jgi:hypothetical protein